MKINSALLVIIFLISCGSNEKELNKEKAKKTFNKPFQGTIEAEEVIGSAIIKKKIKYSISKNFIKRESVLQDILDKSVNGIICDLNLNEVTLYRSKGDKKFYVKLKVEEYLVLRESFLISNPFSNQVFEEFPFGTIFADLPQKGEYSIVKNEVEVNSFSCKESEIKHLNIHLIVDHCEEIEIDKKLLELVELGYPEKINGMAINVIKKYSAIERKEEVIDLGKLGKIVNKAEAIASKIKSILNFKFTIKEIIEKAIDDSEFKLAADFLEAKTFSEMISNTKVETSGDMDWD